MIGLDLYFESFDIYITMVKNCNKIYGDECFLDREPKYWERTLDQSPKMSPFPMNVWMGKKLNKIIKNGAKKS